MQQSLRVQPSPALRELPLATLYLTERCNSRCLSCDYWQHGRDDMTLESVTRLLPSLKDLGTQGVLLSGGEPLLNPEWAAIAERLRDGGFKVWLLTSGLSLAKNARRAAAVFDSVTVSLDGTDAATYAKIRGLDAFEKVCEGIRMLASCGLSPAIRVTVQRANYRQLPSFVTLAKALGARQVSFLAIDVANTQAFGRKEALNSDLALAPGDLPRFAQVLKRLERECAAEFRSGFIAESPQKLQRLHQYFAAVCGQGSYPDVRCNAPEFSAVISARGRVQPCFFIEGSEPASIFAAPATPGAGASPDSGASVAGASPGAMGGVADLAGVLNSPGMAALRGAIRAGERAECKTCVCSLWRDSNEIGSAVQAFDSARQVRS